MLQQLVLFACPLLGQVADEQHLLGDPRLRERPTCVPPVLPGTLGKLIIICKHIIAKNIRPLLASRGVSGRQLVVPFVVDFIVY